MSSNHKALTPNFVQGIHLDAVGGIAGDMFTAAFLDLQPELFMCCNEAVKAMDLGEKVLFDYCAHGDGFLNGTRLLVQEDPPDSTHHTPWVELRLRLKQAKLEAKVREVALGIFEALAQAEAKVHRFEVNEVVFHEVGSDDSIIDILSAAVIISSYGNCRWALGSLPMGRGEVQTEHGKLPVPAPVTIELLKGFAFHDDGEEGERITPTGAAILHYLVNEKGLTQTPDSTIRTLIGSGLGFGTRKLKTKSNVLRVTMFSDVESQFQNDQVVVLRFEIDDQSPEDVAVALDHLRQLEGVLDFTYWPVSGKKGRLAIAIQGLVIPQLVEQTIEEIFNETTTLGVRYREESRKILNRSSLEIEGSRVKLTERPSGTTAKVEVDDLAETRGFGKRIKKRIILEKSALQDNDNN